MKGQLGRAGLQGDAGQRAYSEDSEVGVSNGGDTVGGRP